MFWTDGKASFPGLMARLAVSPADLVLAKPLLQPLALVLCWPVLGVLGLLFAGIWGAVAAAFILIAFGFFGPRRVVERKTVADVSDASVLVAQGWNRVFGRDVVTLAFRDGTSWRMTATGRGETSAARIVNALSKAGIATREIAKP